MAGFAPGASFGLAGRAGGTYGCLVRSLGGEGLFALTAGHVLLTPSAAAGLHACCPGGTGSPVGTLERWIDPLSGDPGANRVDAAIARLTNPAGLSPRIPGIGVPRGRSDHLEVGMPIQLVGATSGYRTGIIGDLDYDATVTLDLPGRPRAEVQLRHLVLCTRCTAGGDSGAAVLNENREVVGIHLGSTNSASYFCRIDNVCNLLNIEIVT